MSTFFEFVRLNMVREPQRKNQIRKKIYNILNNHIIKQRVSSADRTVLYRRPLHLRPFCPGCTCQQTESAWNGVILKLFSADRRKMTSILKVYLRNEL